MDEVDRAFQEIKRSDFLPPEQIGSVDLDAPLPIGFGQTNSQPSTVKMMLEWLEVEPGDRILDVGSGSGWTTALLATLTGPSGMVYAVEIVPELVNFGRENCQNVGITNAKFFEAGKDYGLPGQASFDRILVSAAATQLPQSLINQLKPGGKMVIAVWNEVLEVEKAKNGELDILPHPGFAFVPLIKPIQSA